MRLLVLALIILASLGAEAATKWVDITGTGSGAADGSSVSNQCAGLGDADCIGANLPAGSTQHWCGVLTGAGLTVPVAGSAGNVTTYDCACTGGTNGVIHATSGTAGILANKAYTRVGDYCTVDYTGSKPVQVNASNVTIGRVSVVSPGQDGITLTTPSTLTNVTIDGASVTGMTRYGVIWQNSNGTTNSATDFIIQNSTFSGNANTGIFFQCNIQATACTIVRLSILNNIIAGNGNTGLVIQDCYDGVDTTGTCADPQSYTLARYTDVSITGNRVTGQTAGGGIAIYGCTSSTSTFGKCVISNNISSNNSGVIGGIDLFNSRWVTVSGNTVENNTTSTIDANGILVDYGNRNVVVRGNYINNNIGNSGTDNSGVAVMVLRGQDVDIFGNIGTGNKAGMLTAGVTFVESNVRYYNNTFLNNIDYGWYIDSTQDSASATAYNNILTGPGTCIYAEASGSAQTEDYNDLACTTRKNYNSVAWSDGANSITSSPLLVGGVAPSSSGGFRLSSSSPAKRAGKEFNWGNYVDFGGRGYLHPPSMGGIEETSAGTRSAAGNRTGR